MSDDLLDLDIGLHELTSLLLDEETLASTLERVAAVANRCVTGGNGVSITLVKSGRPYTAHATENRVRSVDDRQYEVGTGPCLTAIGTGEVQVSCDGDGAPEWESVRAHAAACGIHSFLSVPLTIGTETVGSLNVYSDAPDAFGPDEVGSAILLASQAAVSVANARAHHECMVRVEQLQEALDSRIVIEQAKGILMERHRENPDRAFDRLKTSSQHSNTKLRDVAERIVGEMG